MSDRDAGSRAASGAAARAVARRRQTVSDRRQEQRERRSRAEQRCRGSAPPSRARETRADPVAAGHGISCGKYTQVAVSRACARDREDRRREEEAARERRLERPRDRKRGEEDAGQAGTGCPRLQPPCQFG